MGKYFNFSIWDVWNRPEVQVLRKGTKLAVKGMASAGAKEASKSAGTSEYAELADMARNGNAEAQCELAIYYAEKREFEKATFWLEKSAKQGNEQALEILDFFQND